MRDLENLVIQIKQRQRENSPTERDEKQKALYNCNKCKDTGWLFQSESNTAMVCSCVNKELSIIQFKNAGIDIKDQNKSFNTFNIWNDESKNLKNTGIAYYTNYDKVKDTKQNSILLSGNPGSGKTHILLALANNFITTRNIKVVYMNYREVITKLKQNFLDKEYYIKQVSKFQNAEILLIDDLFKGKINDTDINIMFEIINHRYLKGLPIMVSTEYSIEKMLQFDEGTSSRIYEMSKNYLVEISGSQNNFRLKED